MARELHDWITSYIQFTKNSEPPLSYHIWVAISLISSALQRKTYFKWGHSTIYPNQYITLVGPSGQSRKGVALEMGKPFLENINVSIAAQSSTREGFIRAIKDSLCNFTMPNGKVVHQCPVTVISPELQVFLGLKDIRFLADLTDCYDSHDVWTYKTKHQQAGSDTDRLVGVCINILGATAPDWLPSIFPQEAVGGGFTSRMIFVVEEHKGKTITNPNKFKLDEDLRKKLQDDLADIHLLKGEFTFDDEALALYEKWYERQEKAVREGRSPIPDPKFAGYVSRRQTHIKKICMCISASRGNDLLVTKEDFIRAVKLLEATEKKMPKAFSGLGRARFADLTDAVLNYIIRRHSCRRSEIMTKFYRDIDSWTLEQIERVLTGMKVVSVSYLNDEDDAIYKFLKEEKEASHREDETPSEAQLRTFGFSED